MKSIEERINKLEDRTLEIIHSGQQRKVDLKQINRPLETCGTITNDLTFLTSESQTEKRGGRTNKVLGEIMTDNLPNLEEDMSLQIQETERIPNRINSKEFTAKHIKLLKTEIRKKL